MKEKPFVCLFVVLLCFGYGGLACRAAATASSQGGVGAQVCAQ